MNLSDNSIENALILIRGLPGSGKSTFATLLSEGRFPVFSVDDYFTGSNGAYQFGFSRNHLAYRQCEEQTREAMLKKCSRIFVANTFTMDWEMEPYIRMAGEHGYKLFVLTMENYHGCDNIHKIPKDQLEKMASGYKLRLLPKP